MRSRSPSELLLWRAKPGSDGPDEDEDSRERGGRGGGGRGRGRCAGRVSGRSFLKEAGVRSPGERGRKGGREKRGGTFRVDIAGRKVFDFEFRA